MGLLIGHFDLTPKRYEEHPHTFYVGVPHHGIY